MWLRINNIHEKIRVSLSLLCRSKARIKCKNNLFKPCKWHRAFSQNNCVWSKNIYICVLFTSQGLSVLGKTVPEVLDTQNRVRILKGDLKGFQEKFKTKDRIPPAVSGQYGENTARSRNQSDWRICRIPPAHELRKKLKMIFSHLKGAKKQENQSLAKTFKELFSLCPNHFRWNGIVVSEV